MSKEECAKHLPRGKQSSPLSVRVFPDTDDKAQELAEANAKLPAPLPRLHFVWSIVAPRGSGKTNLLLNILAVWYRRVFDQVFLFCPTFHNEPKWKHIQLNEERVFLEYDEGAFQQVLGELSPSKLSLIVFDDCSGEGATSMGTLLSKFVFRHRHYNASLIFVSQYFHLLTKSLRSNTTDLVLFRITNANEVADVAKELGMEQRRLTALLPKERFQFSYFDLRNNAVWEGMATKLGPITP
jgi:hypothetical protein